MHHPYTVSRTGMAMNQLKPAKHHRPRISEAHISMWTYTVTKYSKCAWLCPPASDGGCAIRLFFSPVTLPSLSPEIQRSLILFRSGLVECLSHHGSKRYSLGRFLHCSPNFFVMHRIFVRLERMKYAPGLNVFLRPEPLLRHVGRIVHRSLNLSDFIFLIS